MVREFAYHTVQRADGGENNLYINIYFKNNKNVFARFVAGFSLVALPLHMPGMPSMHTSALIFYKFDYYYYHSTTY